MAHILIVEPDKLLARTYGAAFEHAGYTVTIAHGSQEAVLAADKRTPDLVVLELQLAGQDGIAFLHEFHSYAEWWSVPVVIQSSAAPAVVESVGTALKAELGVVAILYKTTTTLKQLLRVIRDALSSRSAPV